MYKKELSEKWVVLTFDGSNSPFEQSTSVCWICGRKRLYLLDTHTGPLSMVPVVKFAQERFREQWDSETPVIFNSHSDWDHVWGNCAFPSSSIIGHSKCREFMADDDRWNHSLKLFSDAKNGDVIRRLPQITFQNNIDFPEDGLRFFHSPGHSADSSSVFDDHTGVLFVADNLELPLPYLQSHNLEPYLSTLDNYLKMSPRIIVSSHSGLVDVELIHSTKKYIELLIEGKEPDLKSEEAIVIHNSNLRTMIVSNIEEQLRDELGESFDMNLFIQALESNEGTPASELEENLLAAF